MKTRVLLISLVTLSFILCGNYNSFSQNQFDEADVRYKIADMQLGGVYGFYKGQENNDPNTKEAVKRWENRVRVSNINKFERKIVEGKGWLIVHKGTNNRVHGDDIKLTTDNKFDEADVRYKIADMQLGGVYGFYKGQENNDPNTKEAVKRWENRVRVSNINKFERKIVEGKGWLIVHEGTNNRVHGGDIKLTTD